VPRADPAPSVDSLSFVELFPFAGGRRLDPGSQARRPGAIHGGAGRQLNGLHVDRGWGAFCACGTPSSWMNVRRTAVCSLGPVTSCPATTLRSPRLFTRAFRPHLC
jgi:hypothetical protein